jgi:hypothetical protein
MVVCKGSFTLNISYQCYHINNNIDRITTVLVILMRSSIDESVFMGCNVV